MSLTQTFNTINFYLKGESIQLKTEKELRVKFADPISADDTPYQTYGCRANNPDICGNCYMENVCAFVREDAICKRPSAAWKKQYYKLLNQGD